LSLYNWLHGKDKCKNAQSADTVNLLKQLVRLRQRGFKNKEAAWTAICIMDERRRQTGN